MSDIIDIDLIKMKNQYKKETTGNASEGMIVEEENIQFIEEIFFDGLIKIKLPEFLKDMPLEYAKLKYPMENRPPIIKSNDMTDVNITLSIIPQKIMHDSIKNFTAKMIKAIKRMQPAAVFYETKYIDFSGNCKDNLYLVEEHDKDRVEISYFEFRSVVVDNLLYNLNAFAFFDDQIVYIGCNCIFDQNQKWKKVFLEIIKSIRR